MQKDTNDLFSEVNNIVSFEEINNFQQKNENELVIPKANEYLLQVAAQKNIDKAELIKSSGIERTHAYHLLSGTRRLTREKILKFSLAGKLGLEITQNILKYANEACLYARNRRDVVIIYALNKQKSVIETNCMLSELGHEVLE